MIQLGTLNYFIGADATGLDKAEKRVKQFVDKSDSQFDRLGNAAKRLGGVLLGVVAVDQVRRAVMLADSYATLQQRIKTATKATGDFVAVSSQVAKIATENGVALGTTVSLFQGLARTAPELRASNAEILTFTDTLAKLGVIGGSTQSQMDNGLLQLTQGLGAGIFRAEEFNSVLENTPEIANRIAQGMGLTVGELRRAVLDGKILSEDVFKSLMGQSATIAAEFGEMPLTIGRAGSALQTSFMGFLGQLDQASGGTSAIAGMIQYAANVLAQDWTPQLTTVAAMAYGIGDSIRNWAILAQPLGASIGALATSLNTVSIYAQSTETFTQRVAALFRELPRLLETFGSYASTQFAKLITIGANASAMMSNEFQILWNNVQAFGESAAQAIASIFAKLVTKVANALLSLIDKIPAAIRPAMEGLKGLAREEQIILDGIEAQKQQRKEITSELWRQEQILSSNQQAELDGISAVHEANVDAINEKYDLEAFRAMERDKAREAARAKAAQDNVNTGVSTVAQGRIDGGAASGGASGGSSGGAGGPIGAMAYASPTEDPRVVYEREKYELLSGMSKDYYTGEEKMMLAANAFGIKTMADYDAMSLAQKDQNFQDNLAMAASFSKESFAAIKAVSLAIALIEAPASILSAIKHGTATGGWVKGAAMGAAAAAATAAKVAQIKGAQFSGGKATGGNVHAGGAYRVNEQGPELLSVGGEDFLMMGSQGGNITPNSKLGREKSGNITVNVHPQPGQTARVETRQTPQGTTLEIILETVENAIASGISRGGSAISSVLENQYGLNRVAGISY